MVNSLLASISDNGQGSQPRKKEEVGRLQRRVRTFKGNLTQSISSCNNSITYYKTKYPMDDDTEISSVKIDYAKDILASLDCANDRYTKLEKALDELRMLVSDTWEDEDDELEEVLEKLPSNSSLRD